MILEKLEAISCEQLGLVSTCLRLKNRKICFQNQKDDRENENGRRQTTFGFDNKMNFSDKFC